MHLLMGLSSFHYIFLYIITSKILMKLNIFFLLLLYCNAQPQNGLSFLFPQNILTYLATSVKITPGVNYSLQIFHFVQEPLP